MKKLLSIILLLAMLSCFACSNKTEPGGQDAAAVTDAPTAEATTEPTAESTEITFPLTCHGYVDTSNGGVSASSQELTEELNIWLFSALAQQRTDAPETYDITFDNLTYHGKYRSSDHYGFSSFTADEYKSDKGTFEIRAGSDDLVGINWFTVDSIENENAKADLADPRAETEAIARSFAEKLLDATDYDFTLSVTERTENGIVEYDYYSYYFFKRVFGEQTNDRFLIKVSSKGTVCGWMLYDVGAFDPLPQDISRFEGVDLDAMIEAKVNECLNRNDLKYADLEIYERMFCVSPVDGGTVMYVDLKVPAEVLGEEFSQYIYIIIK